MSEALISVLRCLRCQRRFCLRLAVGDLVVCPQCNGDQCTVDRGSSGLSPDGMRALDAFLQREKDGTSA
jgi:hypothetical protein